MRLLRLGLQDVYGFRMLDLPFPSSHATVLIGRNGAGKSSILDAIAMFLAPVAQEMMGRDPRSSSYPFDSNAVRLGAARASATLDVDRDGDELQQWAMAFGPKQRRPEVPAEGVAWARHLRETLGDDGERAVPVLCYYPSNRRQGLERAGRAKAKPILFPQLAAYEGAYPAGLTSAQRVSTWFRQAEDLENEVRLRRDPTYRDPAIEIVRATTIRFLNNLTGRDEWSDLRVRRSHPNAGASDDDASGEIVIRKRDAELPLRNLSDGERSLLLLVSDIGRRLLAANPAAKDPLGGSGVILIDEIEMHLHPGWQQAVLPALLKTFPGCQFVVTTHSPQVLSTAPNESVALIENFQVVRHLHPSNGRDVNGILSEVFGVAVRPKESAERIHRVAELIDAGDLDGARTSLGELETSLGETDADVIGLRAALKFSGE